MLHMQILSFANLVVWDVKNGEGRDGGGLSNVKTIFSIFLSCYIVTIFHFLSFLFSPFPPFLCYGEFAILCFLFLVFVLCVLLPFPQDFFL